MLLEFGLLKQNNETVSFISLFTLGERNHSDRKDIM